MNIHQIRDAMLSCEELHGLDERLLGLFLWRVIERRYEFKEKIYKESDPLNNTFYLLLEGVLEILQKRKGSKGYRRIRTVDCFKLFGGNAYFTSDRRRTATVTVKSQYALLLEFKFTREEIDKLPFYFGRRLGNIASALLAEDQQRNIF